VPTFRLGDTVAAMSFAYKAADQSQSSTIVLLDDTDLQVPVIQNRPYLVEIFLTVNNAAGTAGFKFALAVPSGTTMNGQLCQDSNNDGTLIDGTTRTDLTALPALGAARWGSAAVNAGDNRLHFSLIIQTSTTAGLIKCQWAQSVSDAGATIVARGSFMRVTRLA
jgi:hypothetical protein